MRYVISGMFFALLIGGCFMVHHPTKVAETITDPSEWVEGEFVMYQKQLPHHECDGYFQFNGESKPAPYSEQRFYTHVCNKCSTTNSILNETWPKHKREWRAK